MLSIPAKAGIQTFSDDTRLMLNLCFQHQKYRYLFKSELVPVSLAGIGDGNADGRRASGLQFCYRGLYQFRPYALILIFRMY